MSRETIQRVASPTAILVGIPEPLAKTCSDTLADNGLRVLKAAHAAAAAERIPVVMPQLVLVSTTLHQAELEMLNDRCVAVGARALPVAPEVETAALVSTLKTAANEALVKALRGI